MKMSLKQKIYHKIPEKHRDKVARTYHTLRTVKNIVCWTLIAALAVTVVIFLTMRLRGETPSVFGYTLHRVQTGSMEPALHVGDVILNKHVDDVSALEVGDIITFQGGSYFDNNHITHRVLVKPYMENGVMYLQTQGDANDIADPVIEGSSVESVFVTKIRFLNVLYNFFLSPWGLIIFILLLLFVFFDEVLNIGRIVSGNYDDEEEEDIGQIIERIQREEQEKKREELRRQQQQLEKEMKHAELRARRKEHRAAVKSVKSAGRMKRKKSGEWMETVTLPVDEVTFEQEEDKGPNSFTSDELSFESIERSVEAKLPDDAGAGLESLPDDSVPDENEPEENAAPPEEAEEAVEEETHGE